MLKFLNLSREAKQSLENRRIQNLHKANVQSFTERKAKEEFIQQRKLNSDKSLSDEAQVSLVMDSLLATVCDSVVDNVDYGGQVCIKSATKEKTSKQENRTVLKVKARTPTHSTWNKKAKTIYMLLHPQIFNGNCDLAGMKLGFAPGTLRGWISTKSKNNFIPLWFDIVNNMTFLCVKKHFSEKIIEEFCKDVSDESTVCLKKFKPFKGSTVVLSADNTSIKVNQRAKLGKVSKQEVFRGEREDLRFLNINKNNKHIFKSNWCKHPDIEKVITEYIILNWNRATPVTRTQVYNKLREIVDKENAFYKQYLDPTKRSADKQLIMWVTRLLKKIGFTVRENTVSQCVPSDWHDKATEFSNETLEKFRCKNVDVLINADQTFVKFLCSKEKVIAPMGVKRVGNTVVTDDERKGITVMVTVAMEKDRQSDFIKGRMLPPFLVFEGQTGKILDKKYEDWADRPGHCASVNFQKNHWFDGPICLRYVKWLLRQFPTDLRLGLVWDLAPSHTDSTVKQYLDEQETAGRLFCAYIPAGMTSVLQVCDVAINKPLKQHLKTEYLVWKDKQIQLCRENDGSTVKINVKTPRDNLIIWCENHMKLFNDSEATENLIQRTFSKVGQNIFSTESEELEKWLNSLSENALYRTLLESHTEVNLTN